MITNELAIGVASRSTLPVIVVKSALTVISTAVDDAGTSKDELPVSSSRISLAEGSEADAGSKDVGISESRSVAGPTLISVGTESN